MKYLKHIHYVYIFFAIAFIIDGIERLDSADGRSWLSFAIASVALFMFFFRKKYSKKFEDRYNNRKS